MKASTAIGCAVGAALTAYLVRATRAQCIEGTHEVLEYCPDGVTEKRWRDCINGKWVYDERECPEEEEAEIVGFNMSKGS